jgi:adenosyl cobinamide kinase/adenosyl cobinamide phosphate guanylyltransferase
MSEHVDVPAPSEPARQSTLGRLGGIIVSPVETLQSIVRRPDWIIPLLLLIAVGAATSLASSRHVDVESSVRAQMERQEQKMSEAQIEQTVAIATTVQKFSAAVTVVFIPLVILVVAAVLFGAFKAFGGESGFVQVFSVVVYSWIPEIIKWVISAVLIVNRGTVTAEEATTLVRSNLGFLSGPDNPVLFSFLTSLDLFSLWGLALLVVGLALANRFSYARSAAIIVPLWLLVILGKLGLAALQAIGGGA